MDVTARVVDIIEGAEKALAALAAEAAAEREYGQAGALLRLAQRVADAARSRDLDVLSAPGTPDGNGHETESPSARAQSETPGRRLTGRVGAVAGNEQYPRFVRERDALVKIGWSKSERAPYEHRSSRAVLDRVVAGILAAGGRGQRVTTDDLLPLFDTDGTELPAYQCYLCLAWLVTAGLVERHGRQGYTIQNPSNLTRALEAAWDALAAR